MNQKSLKNKRVFITGARGFIGSHLVDTCLKMKAHVGALVREERNISRLFNFKEKLDIFPCSITNKKKLHKIINQFKPEYVFHLAANLDRQRDFSSMDELYDIHVNGTQYLIESLLKKPWLKRFVHVGTIEEYGSSLQAPFRETQHELPFSTYSLTKNIAVKLVEYASRQEKFKGVIVRPSLIYGPAQKRTMFIPSLIWACINKKKFDMTKGEQTRDFLFIEDLLAGLISAAIAPGIEGEIINLGSGKEIMIRKVAEMIHKMVGNPIKIAYGAIPYNTKENMHFFLHTEKAKKMLGWKPKIDLAEGLSRTISWYKKNPENS